MSKKDEFYVGYLNQMLPQTRRKLLLFIVMAFLFLILAAVLFAMSQRTFKNSTFELTQETTIEGVYHEMPYPMLRVDLGNNEFKNIMLLGFGKSSATPYLEALKTQEGSILNKKLRVKGNLIYYNGKTLIQVVKPENIEVIGEDLVAMPSFDALGNRSFEGEIIDPKCYFGVMKPGRGKIHRSCAVRCISGGIPPVLATSDSNGTIQYLLVTDISGKPLHNDLLPFIGKPLNVSGEVVRWEDWHILKVEVEALRPTNEPSKYVSNEKCQSDCAPLHFREAFAQNH